MSVGVGAYLYVRMGVCRICSARMWSSACVHVYYLLLFLSVWNTAHGFYSFIIGKGRVKSGLNLPRNVWELSKSNRTFSQIWMTCLLSSFPLILDLPLIFFPLPEILQE